MPLDDWAVAAQQLADNDSMQQDQQAKAAVAAAPAGTSSTGGLTITKPTGQGPAPAPVELPPQQQPAQARVLQGGPGGVQWQNLPSSDPWEKAAAQTHLEDAIKAGNGQDLTPLLRQAHRIGALPEPDGGPSQPSSGAPGPSTPFGQLVHDNQAHQGIGGDSDQYVTAQWAQRYGQALVDQHNPAFEKWVAQQKKVDPDLAQLSHPESDPHVAAMFLKATLPPDQVMQQENRFKAEYMFLDTLRSRDQVGQAIADQYRMMHAGATDDQIYRAVHQQFAQLGVPEGTFPPFTVKQGQVDSDVSRVHGTMDAFLRGAGALVYKPAEYLEGLGQSAADLFASKAPGARTGQGTFEQMRSATSQADAALQQALPQSTAAQHGDVWAQVAEGTAEATPGIVAFAATAGAPAAALTVPKNVLTAVNYGLMFAQQGGQAYQDIYEASLKRGMTKQEASLAAGISSTIDATVNTLVMKYGVAGSMQQASLRGYISSVIRSAGAQGGVTALQTVVDDLARGDTPTLDHIMRSYISGAATGAAFAAANPAGVKAAWRDFSGATDPGARASAAEAGAKGWGNAGGLSDADARQWLGLDAKTPLTREQVIDAWKDKVQQVHPDHGGTADDFQKTLAARAVLLGTLGRPGSGQPSTAAPAPAAGNEPATAGTGQTPNAEPTPATPTPAAEPPVAGPAEGQTPAPTPPTPPHEGPGGGTPEAGQPAAGETEATGDRVSEPTPQPEPDVAGLNKAQQDLAASHDLMDQIHQEAGKTDELLSKAQDLERRLAPQQEDTPKPNAPHPAELASAHDVGQWYAETFNDPEGATAIEALASMAGDEKYVLVEADPSKIDANSLGNGDTNHAKVGAINDLPEHVRGELPPIIAVPMGDSLAVADGGHRLAAAQSGGWASIKAYVPASFAARVRFGINAHGSAQAKPEASVAKTETPAASRSAQKEPWQMTRKEFLEHAPKERGESMTIRKAGSKLVPALRINGKTYSNEAAQTHAHVLAPEALEKLSPEGRNIIPGYTEPGAPEKFIYQLPEVAHKIEVKDALARGESVPDEVLAEYGLTRQTPAHEHQHQVTEHGQGQPRGTSHTEGQHSNAEEQGRERRQPAEGQSPEQANDEGSAGSQRELTPSEPGASPSNPGEISGTAVTSPGTMEARDLTDEERNLLHALSHVENWEKRWSAIRASGADDATLRKFIAKEFGIDSGAVGDNVNWRAKGGLNPRLWTGPESAKVELKGTRLLKMVRHLLGIGQPGEPVPELPYVESSGQHVLQTGGEEPPAGGTSGAAGEGNLEGQLPATARAPGENGPVGGREPAGGTQLPGPLQPPGGERGKSRRSGRVGERRLSEPGAPAPGAEPVELRVGSGAAGGGITRDDAERARGEAPPANAGNYIIHDAAALESGGAKTHFKFNVAAIELLRKIQGEGRERATPAEQDILARFSGWGRFPAVFNEYESEWKEERQILKDLLVTQEAWEAARRSTINAHYTSAQMVQTVYQALTRLGFKGGRMLEPSAGVAKFFGLLPDEMRARAKLTGIELDPTPAAIARLLYPDANIQNKGFQDVQIPDGFFDAGVGNVPFGDIRIHDPRYNALRAPMHDYFFLKTLDKTHPGGLVAMITSTGTLDKATGEHIRKALAERGELVAAARLPDGAFQQVAGTQVVTDLLIFRRLNEGEKPIENFTKLGQLPDPAGGEDIPVNEWFQRNPDDILGTLDTKSRLYGKGDMHVSMTDDFNDRVKRWLDRLPENVYVERKKNAAFEPTKLATAGKERSYSVVKGKLYQRDKGALVPATEVDKKALPIVTGMIEVRDALRALIDGQLEAKPQEELDELRKQLRKVYDKFTGKHGALHKRQNAYAFADDPDQPVVLALEKTYDPKTGKAELADVFTKNTIRGQKRAARVETVADALPVVLNEKGRLDLARVAELTRQTEDEAGKELVAKGLGFKDPAGGWATSEQYLSGNVRKRLIEAQEAAAADPAFLPNVKALEKVIPTDVDYDQIGVRLGSAWLPPSDIAKFAADTLGGIPEHFDIRFLTQNGTWLAGYTRTGESRHSHTPQSRQIYGTEKAPFIDVLDRALNGKQFYFTKPGAEANSRVPDPEATDAANGKLKDLQEVFKAWVWEDDDRRQRLARFYNDTFNNIAPVDYDGSHQTFPGMNPGIELRKHQRDAVWQGVSAGNLLLAHEVGTGKTYTMATIGMERRRLGLSRKPAIAVPKKNQATIINQSRALYPAARIHVVEDFDAKGRKQAVARIATGDFDLVILTHDHLNMLPMDPEVEADFIRRELAELEEVKRATEEEGGGEGFSTRRRGKSKSENRQVKELEKIKARLEERLKEALGGKRDNAVTFEQTGIDFLMVDEAHAYKSLPVYTKHERVKGIPSSANRSDRATSMWMRTQWLQNMNGGQGVVFATGTPVTNTMTELYTMQRYLQMKELQERGIASFDAWASTFGQMNTRTEYTVAGEYKPVTRFNGFINLPELQRISRQSIDVVRGKDLPNFQRPKRRDQVVKVPMTDEQKHYLQVIKQRAIEAKKKRPGEKGDNMLSITTDARKSSVDHRLVDPGADMTGGKVDRISQNVLRILQENPGTTQMVFSDFGLHPTETNKFTFFRALTEALVNGGIPADRIVNFTTLTDKEEKRAADRLNSGDAIVGLASTTAGGTGINAQQHLIALHHADVPWRPGDVEQRDGRAWRQGNRNAAVHILRYVTEGGFDTFMWQAVDAKSKFIGQFLEGDNVKRAVTEQDSEELTPAQVMAIASGDPDLLERINLEAELREMEASETRHKRQELKLRDTAVELKKKLDNTTPQEKLLKAAVAAADAHKGDAFSIDIHGQTIEDRGEAEKALDEAIRKLPVQYAFAPTYTVIGSFRGFELAVVNRGGEGNKARLNVAGVEVFPTASINSIEYYARTGYWEGRLGDLLNTRKTLTADLAKVQTQLGRPFPHEGVLKQKRAELETVQGRLAAKSKAESEGQGKPPEAANPGAYAPHVEGEGGGEGVTSAPTSKQSTASPLIFKKEGAAAGVAAAHGLNILHPIAMPELVKLATELLGSKPLIKKLPRSSALFTGRGAFGKISIDPRRVKGAFELAKVLAHEVGHLEDWLPDNTLKRGNLLGRLLKLHKFLKQSFGTLTVTNKDLRKELIDLSEWWTPYDKSAAKHSYIQYRNSPRELYAEALSVLLNAPGEVEARAPGFYKAFLELLDRHQDFRDAYLDLQDLLAGTPEQLAEARRNDVREAYRKGEEILKARALERIEGARGSILMTVRQLLFDALSPALSKQRAAEKKVGGQLPAEQNAKWAHAELTYADNEAHLWLKSIDEQVHEALGKAGLTPEDLGEYLQMVRTETERADLANPGGHNPETAKQMQADLRQRLGAAGWKALQDVAQTFHDLVHEKVREARDVGYYNEATYKEVLEPNKYRYATFAVLDHLQDSIAPGIAHQVGTFKEVANPYTATVLKTVSLIRAIQLQKAKLPLVRMLKAHFGGEIEKAKPRVLEGGRRQEPGRPPAGRDWLVVYEDGRPEWYAVDPYIARIFQSHDIGLLSQVGKWLQRATYGVFHPLYVTFNVGWHLRLLPKDFARVYRNSAFKGKPTTLAELLGAYWKALPSAYRLVVGKPDPVVEKMLKDKALAVPWQQWDFQEEHDSHQRLLDRYGLGTPAWYEKNPATQFAMKILHAVEGAGNMLVSTPKIAGWHVLTARGMSGLERSYRVRNFFGHPDRKRRGLGTNLSNGVSMYSNILIQFLRADAEAATDPKTRSGWWVRTVLTSILPKLLMRAAAAGLLGLWLKKMFDLIPEADKTKYLVVPLWMTTAADGKTRKAVYARIPRDVLGTMLEGTLWKLTGNSGESLGSKAQQALDVPYADGPHMNPWITSAGVWADYLHGQNPWDSYRQRNIVPEQEWKAGGWYAGKPIIQWQLNQLGILSTLAHAAIGKPGEQETLSETILGSVPGGFVQESNRGILEQEELAAALDDQEKTRFRLGVPAEVREAVRERYRLDLIKSHDTDPTDAHRRAVYTAWYDRVYLPLMRAMQQAKDRGDTKTFDQLRSNLEKSAQSLH